MVVVVVVVAAVAGGKPTAFSVLFCGSAVLAFSQECRACKGLTCWLRLGVKELGFLLWLPSSVEPWPGYCVAVWSPPPLAVPERCASPCVRVRSGCGGGAYT